MMKRILDMRAFVFCVVLAFAIITLPGCSSEFSKNSYTTLATLGATYDGVLSVEETALKDVPTGIPFFYSRTHRASHRTTRNMDSRF